MNETRHYVSGSIAYCYKKIWHQNSLWLCK